MNFPNKIELCFQKNSALRAKIFRLFRMSTFFSALRASFCSQIFASIEHQNPIFSLAPSARLIVWIEQSDHFAPQARNFWGFLSAKHHDFPFTKHKIPKFSGRRRRPPQKPPLIFRKSEISRDLSTKTRGLFESIYPDRSNKNAAQMDLLAQNFRAPAARFMLTFK